MIARPSGRELFGGDFRAVRQQTAVFFDDTHTHTHIYRRTQTLNPPLRIGAPGNKVGCSVRMEDHNGTCNMPVEQCIPEKIEQIVKKIISCCLRVEHCMYYGSR